MLRLCMDVHIKAAITAGLRRRGSNVVTAQEDEGVRLGDAVACQALDPEAMANRIEYLPLG